MDSTEKKTDSRVEERLAPVTSKPLETSAAPRTGISMCQVDAGFLLPTTQSVMAGRKKTQRMTWTE